MAGDIFIYGGIGTERGEISSENVRAQIEQNKGAEELVLHIISPGGDVFEGESIYNALKNTGKKITTHIEGTCASIATLIAGAGDRIVMNKTARFMIHNPKVSGMASAADSRMLRSVAEQLDQIKGLLINVWDKKTSIGKEKLWELYDNETWLTAEQAEQMGFIDESVDAIKAVAKVDFTKFQTNMENKNVVSGLIKRITNALKFKNEMTETLEDGRVVVVMSEDGDFAGKQVIFEDGSPVPAGEHKLASGKTLVVDGASTITEVKEAEPVDNSKVEQDMEKDKEIENLKAQLAEAQAKAQEAVAQVTTAKAETLKFQNKVTSIEKDFLALKEEALKTVGEKVEVGSGPVFKNTGSVQDFDPMGEEARKFYKNRNL
jgi:ATP-dependent protease ClpP protease subunit